MYDTKLSFLGIRRHLTTVCIQLPEKVIRSMHFMQSSLITVTIERPGAGPRLLYNNEGTTIIKKKHNKRNHMVLASR